MVYQLLNINNQQTDPVIHAMCSGPPIAGWLVDKSGNKDYAFYLSAALLFSSAVICVAAWLAQKAIVKRRAA